jgi:transducin (beta)-like 1
MSGVDRAAPPGTGVISLREHFAPPCVQGDLTSLDWNVDGSLIAIGSYDSVLRVCHASGELFLKDETHKVRTDWLTFTLS